MIVEVFSGGQRDRAIEDHINVGWYFRELLLTYKYGEKYRYEKALKALKPYMSDELYDLFKQVHDDSLWTNPITGKKGS